MPNALYYGDNLDVLRESIATESVDLIYLDPPFNSQATYNVLFRSPTGSGSQAQIEAFEDTWHWGQESEGAFDQVMHAGSTDAADMLRAFRSFLGENDMMAYLAMMGVRMIELHRVLKPTGSLYLHCDPTTSHYLKVLLDAVFSASRFLNEITWKRTSSHNTARRLGKVADTILFYSKSDVYTWNPQYTSFSPEQLSRYKPDDNGRLYKAENLTADRANSTSGKFVWRGTMPPQSRGWGYTMEQLEKWWSEGQILTRRDGSPRMDGLKVYLDELHGQPLQSIWTDIERVGNTSHERLGYPTQKPLALLERIIRASSNEGDIVLDPFCGCGTATHAAQKLGRQWIGIDITHLAISLIERRLRDAFPNVKFDVHGTPKDIDGARDLAGRDKYQFQWWAVSLIDAQPFGGKKRGADSGIDGLIYFRSGAKTTERAIVSVKGGGVNVSMVRDLKGVLIPSGDTIDSPACASRRGGRRPAIHVFADRSSGKPWMPTFVGMTMRAASECQLQGGSVLDREKAPIGVFLSLEPPTRPMETEAASAGFYALGDRHYPRIQIITIEDALAGAKPSIPLVDTGATFRRAAREPTSTQSTLL